MAELLRRTCSEIIYAVPGLLRTGIGCNVMM